MPETVLIRAFHSHLYRGTTIHLSASPAAGTPQPAVIEFADGSGANATLQNRDADTCELIVDEYVTQKRNTVAGRRWLLRQEDAARSTWHVVRRLP